METDLSVARAVASQDRRGFLLRLGVGAALFAVPGAFAEELFRIGAVATGEIEVTIVELSFVKPADGFVEGLERAPRT